MTVVSCKLPKKLAAKLERLAKDEKRSRQAVVRDAIERRLGARRSNGKGSAFDLIKHLVGTLEGPPDLGTNPSHMRGFGE
jgi:metal-responsive CopG/Arc/MetJ family transcriptional regulator